MKYLLMIGVLMVSLSAQADVSLGTISCDWRGLPSTSGKCGTEQKIKNFGMAEIGKKLGCWGEGAQCNAVKDETYTVEIEINNTSYCELIHITFSAKVFFAPTNPNHFLTYYQDLELVPWTCQHEHTCMGEDPFD